MIDDPDVANRSCLGYLQLLRIIQQVYRSSRNLGITLKLQNFLLCIWQHLHFAVDVLPNIAQA